MKSHLVMYAVPSSSNSLSIWKEATYQLPRIYQVTRLGPGFQIYPIGSMYGIFTYIYHKHQPNVGEYTIHGSYGYRELQDDGIPQDWSRIKDAPSKVKGDRLAAMAAVRQSPEVCDSTTKRVGWEVSPYLEDHPRTCKW